MVRTQYRPSLVPTFAKSSFSPLPVDGILRTNSLRDEIVLCLQQDVIWGVTRAIRKGDDERAAKMLLEIAACFEWHFQPD